MKTKLYILIILIAFGSIGAMVLKPSNSETPVLNVVDSVKVVEVATNDESTKILFFGDTLYSYKLEFTGENVKIIYTHPNDEPIIERGKFIDGKIIVNGCDYCYKFENTTLCVYKEWYDTYDCYYDYDESKSNCSFFDIFN